jgi:K+-transporting ATPase C subunit
VIIIALIPLALSVARGTGHWARRRCCAGTCSFHTSFMPGQPRHENIDRLDFPKTALPLRQVRKHLNIAVRFTIVTTIVFGLIYALVVTGLSQLTFPRPANGSLVEKNG